MEQTTETSEGSVTFEQKLSMTVTDLAKQKLGEMIGDDRSLDEYGIRLSVQPGGCSGASYGMGYAAKPEQGELTLVANGVRIFLSPEHAPLLNGLVVDFVDELMGGGFKIENPNATSSCGCGKSFSA